MRGWLVGVVYPLLAASALVFAYDEYADLPVEPGPAPTKPAPKAPLPPPAPPYEPPPPAIFGRDIKTETASLVYVLDISGSMETHDGGLSTSRLERAKAELVRSVTSLPSAWRFSAVAYDCAYQCLATPPEYIRADEAGKARAVAWLSALRVGGATGTGPAVAMTLNGYKDNRLVVLLTDGAPNCGAGDEMGGWSCIQAHESQVRWANQQGARIDVFGIGATGEFRQFCLDVAALGRGSYSDVR